jgi:hypothetical protein
MALSFFRSSSVNARVDESLARHPENERKDHEGPPTLLSHDSATYLGDDPKELGRRISATQLEMFVDVAPAHALALRLAQLRPIYIALHDIACAGSEPLLQALSAATQRPLQQLVIRRQGVGLALATIPFIEVPAGQGKSLRIFSSRVQSDRVHHEALAQALLTHASLSVVLVGELTHHMVGPAFAALAMPGGRSASQCTEALLVPLGGVPFWAQSVPSLLPHLSVRITPTVQQAAESWAFISGAWSRLRKQPAKAHAEPAGTGFFPSTASMETSADLSLRTRPQADFARVMSSVADLARLAGVEACCAFDVHTAQPWTPPPSGSPAAVGRAQANLAAMARQAKALLDVSRQTLSEHYAQSPRQTGLAHVMVQAPPHLVMIQTYEQLSGLAVAVWLNTELGNAKLVNARLKQIGSEAV